MVTDGRAHRRQVVKTSSPTSPSPFLKGKIERSEDPVSAASREFAYIISDSCRIGLSFCVMPQYTDAALLYTLKALGSHRWFPVGDADTSVTTPDIDKLS